MGARMPMCADLLQHAATRLAVVIHTGLESLNDAELRGCVRLRGESPWIVVRAAVRSSWVRRARLLGRMRGGHLDSSGDCSDGSGRLRRGATIAAVTERIYTAHRSGTGHSNSDVPARAPPEHLHVAAPLDSSSFKHRTQHHVRFTYFDVCEIIVAIAVYIQCCEVLALSSVPCFSASVWFWD